MFTFVVLAAALYAVYKNTSPEKNQQFITDFKDNYFPKESGFLRHMTRNVQGFFGFSNGNNIGKVEYTNPLPLVVLNEFNDTLNETSWGYAGTLKSKAINTVGYKALIHDQFNIQEHPRLDWTRQSAGYGQKRRAQSACWWLYENFDEQ